MIWKWLPTGRTRIGSRIPFSRTDATSSLRSPITCRGCCGFGVMSSMGTICPTGRPLGRPSWSTKCGSCRMRTVSGSPKRRGRGLDTFDDLLAEAVVLVGAARLGSEGEDALLVGRALLEADALRDGGAEDAVAEHLGDRLADVLRECGPLVVERDHRPQQLEVRVRTGADLLDGLQQVVGSFEGEVARLHRDQQVGRRHERVDRDEAER